MLLLLLTSTTSINCNPRYCHQYYYLGPVYLTCKKLCWKEHHPEGFLFHVTGVVLNTLQTCLIYSLKQPDITSLLQLR